MLSLCKRWRLEIEDWLRYHPRIRRAICRYKLWRFHRPDPSDPQAVARSIVHLCTAARLTEDAEVEREIQGRITEQVRQLDVSRLDWSEFAPDFANARIDKAAILKPFLAPAEKGVVYISFEREWVKVLGQKDVRAFAQRYTLVIAPSSSLHNLFHCAFPIAYPEPIFAHLSHAPDRDLLPRVSSRYLIVPLFTSHWVNPELFVPLPKSERSYDLIMVASWGKVKRHQALFSALRFMPRDFRILLVGQDQEGRTADTVRELARWYGVADRFTILTNQPYRDVPKLFCQARASAVLSKREGSCVAVAESMFVDAPVAILRGADIGSRAFINDQTGRFLEEATLARDLTDFVHNADRYRPRAWAEQNISCFRSSQILNDCLKEQALASGQAWTQDIAPLQWAPDPQLAWPEDRARLAAERQDIQERFGLELGPAPVQ